VRNASSVAVDWQSRRSRSSTVSGRTPRWLRTPVAARLLPESFDEILAGDLARAEQRLAFGLRRLEEITRRRLSPHQQHSWQRFSTTRGATAKR
jgi:hypothetical protein